jgi:drug/metabolite transporter (DMT)-like permease
MFMRMNTPWWLPGAALILFGVAMVVFPELLALLVASAFIIAGGTWLSIAYTGRKLRHERRSPVYVYRDERYWTTF